VTETPHVIAWSSTSRRALIELPDKVASAAIEFILEALAENPRRAGKVLRVELKGLHSARRGDFRIIHRLSDRVTIVAIEHRADVYRKR